MLWQPKIMMREQIKYLKNIKFKHNYMNDMLTDAYRTLWQSDSHMVYKLNALDFIALGFKPDKTKIEFEF